MNKNKKAHNRDDYKLLSYQVPAGFEPAIKVLQTSALPLGYGTKLTRRGIEPLSQP